MNSAEATDLIELPSKPDAERGLLGAILIDGALLGRVRGGLAPDDFAAEPHRVIYEAALALADRREGIDLVMVQSELESAGRLGRAGGPAYLSSLVDVVPDVENVEGYARIVREAAVRRRAARVLDERAVRIRRGEPDESLQLPGAKHQRAGHSAREHLRRTYTGPRYPTGLTPLDDLLTPYTVTPGLAKAEPWRVGLYPGKIVTLVGPPHGGKSTLAAQFAHSYAALPGVRIVVLSTDEPGREFVAKLAQLQGFPAQEVESAPDYPGMLDRLDAAFPLDRLMVVPEDDERMTIEDAVELLHEEPADLHVLVIDSLHNAESRLEDPDDSPRELLDKRCDAMKRARRRGVLVIDTSEATKAAYASKDADKRTDPMAAAAESRSIAHSSDLLLVLEAGADFTFRVTVPKNRLTGKKGKLQLILDPGRRKFRGVTEGEAAAREEDAERRLELADENKVLALVRRSPSLLTRQEVPGRLKIRRNRALQATDRLVESGIVEEIDGPKPKRGGWPKRLLRPVSGQEFPRVPESSPRVPGTLAGRESTTSVPGYEVAGTLDLVPTAAGGLDEEAAGAGTDGGPP